MSTTTIERGNSLVITLPNVQQYDVIKDDYVPANPVTVTFTYVDPTGASFVLSLAGGTVILISGTTYYCVVTCLIDGHWRGTWQTTTPNGTISKEWDVTPTSTLG